jgi:hypothetical protein
MQLYRIIRPMDKRSSSYLCRTLQMKQVSDNFAGRITIVYGGILPLDGINWLLALICSGIDSLIGPAPAKLARLTF